MYRPALARSSRVGFFGEVMRAIASSQLFLLLLAVGLAGPGCEVRRSGSRGGGNGGSWFDDDDADDDDDDDDDFSDIDGDGLSRTFEALIGTDPNSADTDEDGFEDGEEYLAFFDPLDNDDFPYEGPYLRRPTPTRDVWEDLSRNAGWNEGDFSRDWWMADQNGQELRLRRFYGQVILIEVVAEWCGPCRAAAEELEEEWTERRDDGFMSFTILTEGPLVGDPPQAGRWAGDFNLTSAIIEDPDRDVASRYMTNAYPSYTIIDRNFQIVDLDLQGGSPDWNLIDDLLDEAPPQVDYPMP
jgi:thiol-disulfide isomerase/thioredoxin